MPAASMVIGRAGVARQLTRQQRPRGELAAWLLQ